MSRRLLHLISSLQSNWLTKTARLDLPLDILKARRYYRDSRGYEHFESQSTFLSGNSPYYLGGAAALFGVYYVSSLEEVPYTHRKHAIMFVSGSYERYLGKVLFEQTKDEAKQQGKLLSPKHPSSQLVRRIGTRIAGVAGDGYGGGRFDHMKDLEWEFAVIQEPTINAFVVPGGKVVVFTGLMDILQSEDELAAVLAHEAGHVVARHQAERMTILSLMSLARITIYVLLGLNLPNAAFTLGFFLPYSRRAETEADLIGLQLAARACYDPTASTTMLQKLHEQEKEHELKTGRRVPVILRTHPLGTERVKKVEEALPSAVATYQRSGCEETRGWLGAMMGSVLHSPLEHSSHTLHDDTEEREVEAAR